MPQGYDPNSYSFLDPAVRSSGRGTRPYGGPQISTPFDPETDPYLADPSIQGLLDANKTRSMERGVEMPTPPPAPRQDVGEPYTPDVPPYMPLAAPEPAAAMQGLEAAAPEPEPYIRPQGGDLSQSPMQANWPLELLGRQQDRSEELARQIDVGGDALGPGRFQSRQDRLKGHMADSPFTGKAAIQRGRDLQDLISGAQLAGFDSPQAQAGYGRKQAEAKIQAPIEQQREQSAGALAVEQERQKGLLATQKEYSDIQRFLGTQSREPGSRFSTSRTGISMTTPAIPRLPPANINRLTAAQENFARYSGSRGSGAELNAAKAAVLNEHPASPDVKQLAQQITADPKGAQQPFAVIQQRLIDLGNNLSEDEFQDLNELLGYLRGRSF